MAIGTAAALLGSAVIGAGSSIISGNKASKAATRASEQNAQLLNNQYNTTRGDLQPYTQLGYGAGNALQQRLGLGGGSQGGYSTGGGDPSSYSAYLAANPDLAQEGARVTADGEFANIGDYLKWHDANYASEGRSSYTDPSAPTGDPAQPYTPPGEDLSWQTMQRPDAGSAPSFSSFFDNTPTQQYRDELANSTRSIDAQAGARQGYFSGGRGLALQKNANQLYAADEQRRWDRANQLYQTALGQYNTNRSVGNQIYDTDRGFGANRYDTNTGNLFNLLGVGANATQSLAGYGAQNANALAANNNASAGAKGNAAINTGNQINSAIGQGIGAYSIYGGGGQYGQPSPSNILAGRSSELRIA